MFGLTTVSSTAKPTRGAPANRQGVIRVRNISAPGGLKGFDNRKPFRPHVWERATHQALPRGTIRVSLIAAKYDEPNTPAGEFLGGREELLGRDCGLSLRFGVRASAMNYRCRRTARWSSAAPRLRSA